MTTRPSNPPDDAERDGLTGSHDPEEAERTSPTKKARARRRLGIAFGAFFVGIWTLVVGGADVMIASQFIAASRSVSFPTAPGQVVSSEVESQRSSGGGGVGRGRTVHRAKISYTYTIGGQTYSGDRVRYAEWSSSSSGHAQSLVQRYPPGAPISVHYNPARPEVSVIEPGLSDESRFVLVFLAPFNFILIGIWAFAWRSLSGRATRLPQPQESGVIRYRLAPVSVFMVAGIFAMAVAVPAVFIFAFTIGTRISALQLSVLAGSIAAAAILGGFWWHWRVASGAYDFTIDPVRQLVRLPRVRCGKDEPREVPLTDVRDVIVVRSETTKVNNQPVKDVVVVLAPSKAGKASTGAAAESRRVRLTSWSDTTVARKFAAALRKRLKAVTRAG